ncbi:alpha/beta hydrolase [Luteimonas sp. SX5]|uniref:Alpha/beta hydrolase n=1 Tax=Luteimonas galliterrae TaxID=2940486 RepID=A0ABT0MKU6_9GAMM|nr:alpha/beta hydrolase [Luteimonas galliterrae]MCL1634870.1 alpha/beta hydrolase [Luteimonas galliterrae]
MRAGRIARGLLAALIAVVAMLALAVIAVWRDPYMIVRAEYARQRIAAGLSLHAVEAAGYRWTYVERDADRADAPTLVMLHGYTGSKENWYRLVQRLDRRYRIVVPDLPGWGQSERKPGADYGYAAQAANVAAFIDVVSERPVVLVGHSMGGGIAAVTAARYPDDVSRVALLDASGVRFKDNRFGIDVLAGKNPFGVVDAASLEHYLGILFHDRAARPAIPWPASKAVIDFRRGEGAFEQSVLDSVGRGPDRFLPYEAAVDIKQPALLLWCRQDQVIDASALDIFGARMPQARRVLLDGCGHMSLMEQPAAVAQAIRALIEKGKPR